MINIRHIRINILFYNYRSILMSSIVNGNFRSEETTLLYKEEITKAIGMHGIWKLRSETGD